MRAARAIFPQAIIPSNEYAKPLGSVCSAQETDHRKLRLGIEQKIMKRTKSVQWSCDSSFPSLASVNRMGVWVRIRLGRAVSSVGKLLFASVALR